MEGKEPSLLDVEYLRTGLWWYEYPTYAAMALHKEITGLAPGHELYLAMEILRATMSQGCTFEQDDASPCMINNNSPVFQGLRAVALRALVLEGQRPGGGTLARALNSMENLSPNSRRANVFMWSAEKMVHILNENRFFTESVAEQALALGVRLKVEAPFDATHRNTISLFAKEEGWAAYSCAVAFQSMEILLESLHDSLGDGDKVKDVARKIHGALRLARGQKITKDYKAPEDHLWSKAPLPQSPEFLFHLALSPHLFTRGNLQRLGDLWQRYNLEWALELMEWE